MPIEVDARFLAPTAAARNPHASAPAWSLIAIVAGGVVSVLLIPPLDHALPGALAPAAFTLSLGLLLGTAVAAARSAISVFRTENILCFGLIYWLLLDLMLGQAGAGRAGYEAVAQSFIAITMFAMALWVGSLWAGVSLPAPGAAPRRAGPALSTRFLFAATVVSGLLGMARVLVGCRFSPGCIVDAFYNPRFSAMWFRIDAFGNFDTLFMYTRYFAFLVLPLTVVLVNREGRFTWRSMTALGLGLICIVFIIGDGGRKDVGTIVGTSLLVWAVMKQRVALRQLAGTAIAAAALVFLMQFMLIARDVGIAAALDRTTTLSSSATPLGTVDRNFRFLGSIVELVPERLPYSGWRGVAYSATVWIPGGIVPSAWQRRTIDLPRAMGMWVGPGYTWTCSAIGDLYLIGGFPIVLLGGLLFGALARLVSRLLAGPPSPEKSILYALLTMTLFLSLRALHEFFVTGLAVLAFWGFLAARRVLLRHAVA